MKKLSLLIVVLLASCGGTSVGIETELATALPTQTLTPTPVPYAIEVDYIKETAKTTAQSDLQVLPVLPENPPFPALHSPAAYRG